MTKKYTAYLEKNTMPFDNVCTDKFSDLKDGFWITEWYAFTKDSNRRYWIPPHRIEHILEEDNE